MQPPRACLSGRDGMNLDNLFIAPPEPCSGIHAECCVHCPSKPGEWVDPECAEIMTWPKRARAETAFPCAWRRNKFCKGYCDNTGLTATDLT